MYAGQGSRINDGVWPDRLVNGEELDEISQNFIQLLVHAFAEIFR